MDGGRVFAAAFAWLLAVIYLASATSRLKLAGRPDPAGGGRPAPIARPDLARLPVRDRGGGGNPVPVRGLGLSLAALQRLRRCHRRPSDRAGPPDAGLSDCRGFGFVDGLCAGKIGSIFRNLYGNKPQHLFAGRLPPRSSLYRRKFFAGDFPALFLRRRVPENGPLKAAVIGAGVFGHHHATKYKALGQAGKMSSCSPLPIPIPTCAPRPRPHHGVPVVADWRELLGKVDLVSVCSPAVTHAEIVRAFLKAGAHVLVEKPIATTMDEADELVALAAPDRPGADRRPSGALRLCPHRPAGSGRDAAGNHLLAPRSLDRPRRRCPRGAGPDDPRSRPGAYAGAGRGDAMCAPRA